MTREPSPFTVLHPKSIYFAHPTSRIMEAGEDMDIDPAIAAAMGFASFGMKSGEKRKYNSNDGYVNPAISSQGQNRGTSSSRTDKAVKVPTDGATMSEDNLGPSTAFLPKRPANATL